MIDTPAFWWGVWQVAAIIYITIGGAIVVAALTVKFSRFVNEQPSQPEARRVSAEGEGRCSEALYARRRAVL